MRRLIALDTETTGKSDDGTPGDHRIIEVGCVEIIDRKITGRTLQLYINPERSVDEEAFKVHGISDDFLSDKPLFKDIASILIDFIRGSELLIHNAKFDVGFMDKEWALLGLNESTKDMATVVDTVALAMKLCPGHQVNLDNLCKLYDVDRSARTLHGALLDAQILAEVYLAMTGGQGSLEFGNTAAAKNIRWKRPLGVQLKVLDVDEKSHVVHVNKEISLAQSYMKIPKTEDHGAVGGTNWSDDYDCELLTPGSDESKKDFKKRLSDQKVILLNKLLSEQQQQLLKQCQALEHQAHEEWLDRVLGRKTANK